ncbi:MAG: phosphotransferase [Patescibacteria group bacterium]
MKTQKSTDRLNYSGDLDPVIRVICDTYLLGSLISFSTVDVGYEDCNILIEAGEGKFLAKMFSKARSADDVRRYVSIMWEVANAGVSHPKFMQQKNGEILFQVHGISLVVMRFVDGKTFFELDRAPDKNERTAVIGQAVKINRINHHPAYIFDSWAIPNIQKIFNRVVRFISPEDVRLVTQAKEQYEAIRTSDLPQCFVHGDLIKSNILRGEDGKIYILDFSVANWYPRIQELAVVAGNLMHDSTNGNSLRQTCKILADDYRAFEPLTDSELEGLYPYALAGVAMDFLGAHQEKYINGNDSDETEYWLTLGRTELRKALA